MFDADRPIISSEQDRLSRAVFAKYLARGILDHNHPESLVIGLYGSSGCGKTSLINLTLEELHVAASNMLDEERPIILNFSPWSYSGQKQMLYSFFRRLSAEMSRAEYFENSTKIIQLLELYVSFFTHQPIPKAFLPKHNVVEKLTRRRRIKDEAYGWESGRDLTLVKAELNELLRKQKHKIIIFIDNISRIEPEEINQVFQIVKSIGDYANTIYVLAMDKPQVIRALDKKYAGTAENFLEKVVQLPFEIPAIAKQDLEPILLDKINKILAIAPSDVWSKEYWADVYYTALKHFFVDARDVTHYINMLSFSFPRVKDVVNPVDYFAMTAIFIFAPQVFYGIRDNKDLFTDLISHVIEFTPQKLAEDKLRCDEIINRAENISREDLQQLLTLLFPRLRSLYQTNKSFYHSESLARKNHRICSADIFDVYFRLSIPENYISAAEMNALLSIARDEEGFALELLRLNQDERIIKFLDLLDSSAIHKIPTEYVSHIINALVDSADLFPLGNDNPTSFNTPMRVHRILHQLFRRFDTAEKRFHLFRDAIKKSTNSLYSIIHELNVQSEEHLESEDTFMPLEHRDFTPEQLQTLKQLAVAKITSWAEIGRLIEHPQVMAILYAWKAWGSEEECKKFVGRTAQDDKGVIAFLCATLKEPIDQAITKFEKNPAWSEYLKNIEDFVSIYILEPHVKMLFEDAGFEKLREREQLAILIFLDLINAETMKVIPKTTV